MRLFLYEYMTATGLGQSPDSPEHGMHLEGRAMRDAVAADLALVPNLELVTFKNGATQDPERQILSAARSCEWSLIIAPETDRIIEQICAAVSLSGSRLLGSTVDALRLCSDKLALHDWWRSQGMPTPTTFVRVPSVTETFPVVWKPRDGAGSIDTYLLRNPAELATAVVSRNSRRDMILQEYVPGQAASVAFLCGPRNRIPLPPSYQHLSGDGYLKYLGGELPIPGDQAARAVSLAKRAIASIEGLVGYVGVDLILGSAADGKGDYAIEINPRLTTSYLGLRALACFNLAEAMLQVAAGRKQESNSWEWRKARVNFRADGATSVNSFHA